MKLKKFKNISELLSSDKTRTVLIVVGLLAVFIIFITSFTGGNEDKKPKTALDSDAQKYCENLSVNLVDMIENIEGAGKSKVLLTLENSYEYVYLDDDETLSKIIEPKIRGVAVLCEGGDDPAVKEKVSLILTTVLKLSISDISVSKLS